MFKFSYTMPYPARIGTLNCIGTLNYIATLKQFRLLTASAKQWLLCVAMAA